VPQVRAAAVSMIEELGCQVFDAYNGHQALQLLEAHPKIEVLERFGFARNRGYVIYMSRGGWERWSSR
jgi:CheY-like chemotaxis protein